MSQEEATVIQRQLDCQHQFVKGMADKIPLCVFCGVSTTRLEELRNQHIILNLGG